ncbi:3'-5' exonuclease [Geomonas sp. Red32]|uniref:3'-5' exonuclease n=1 Tax=Geomonas sp. Red32 TaxID=2912856 RepID=UPI00202CF295|nr:3'-5' exonuclease [Geomonas sp. Red32]MCM0080139.1 3'-5' exonuclease [Geomonas sp. Red32]
MEKGGRFVVVDVETTGFSARQGARVIEVGAVAVENGQLTEEFTTLIDARAPIAAGALRTHGISQAMLRGKPGPSDVWPGFRDFVGNASLVAHNSPFDSSFILNELSRLGHRLPNRWYCTVELSRRKLPHLPNHKLETVARHLLPGLPADLTFHRALDDARLTARVWLALTGDL